MNSVRITNSKVNKHFKIFLEFFHSHSENPLLSKIFQILENGNSNFHNFPKPLRTLYLRVSFKCWGPKWKNLLKKQTVPVLKCTITNNLQ